MYLHVVYLNNRVLRVSSKFMTFSHAISRERGEGGVSLENRVPAAYPEKLLLHRAFRTLFHLRQRKSGIAEAAVTRGIWGVYKH